MLGKLENRRLLMTNAPREVIIMKAIVHDFAEINRQHKLIKRIPYQKDPEAWKKALFTSGYAQNERRSFANPMLIPSLQSWNMEQDSLMELVRLTALLSPLDLASEFNLTMAEPVSRFVALFDMDRPITAISLSILTHKDFLKMVKDQNFVGTTHWVSWFFSQITTTLVLRAAEESRTHGTKRDFFSKGFFATPEPYEKLAKDFNMSDITLVAIDPKKCAMVWGEFFRENRVEPEVIRQLRILRYLWTSNCDSTVQNERVHDATAIRLQSYIKNGVVEVIRDSQTMDIEEYITKYPQMIKNKVIRSRAMNARVKVDIKTLG